MALPGTMTLANNIKNLFDEYILGKKDTSEYGCLLGFYDYLKEKQSGNNKLYINHKRSIEDYSQSNVVVDLLDASLIASLITLLVEILYESFLISLLPMLLTPIPITIACVVIIYYIYSYRKENSNIHPEVVNKAQGFINITKAYTKMNYIDKEKKIDDIITKFYQYKNNQDTNNQDKNHKKKKQRKKNKLDHITDEDIMYIQVALCALVGSGIPEYSMSTDGTASCANHNDSIRISSIYKLRNMLKQYNNQIDTDLNDLNKAIIDYCDYRLSEQKIMNLSSEPSNKISSNKISDKLFKNNSLNTNKRL